MILHAKPSSLQIQSRIWSWYTVSGFSANAQSLHIREAAQIAMSTIASTFTISKSQAFALAHADAQTGSTKCRTYVEAERRNPTTPQSWQSSWPCHTYRNQELPTTQNTQHAQSAACRDLGSDVLLGFRAYSAVVLLVSYAGNLHVVVRSYSTHVRVMLVNSIHSVNHCNVRFQQQHYM